MIPENDVDQSIQSWLLTGLITDLSFRLIREMIIEWHCHLPKNYYVLKIPAFKDSPFWRLPPLEIPRLKDSRFQRFPVLKIPAFINSSKTFAKSFDSFPILSSRNNPFRNIRLLHKPSFRMGLPRTVCGSVSLSVEKMTPFAKIFDKFTMFDMVERRLGLCYVSAVFPIARDWALWRNPRVNL